MRAGPTNEGESATFRPRFADASVEWEPGLAGLGSGRSAGGIRGAFGSLVRLPGSRRLARSEGYQQDGQGDKAQDRGDDYYAADQLGAEVELQGEYYDVHRRRHAAENHGELRE